LRVHFLHFKHFLETQRAENREVETGYCGRAGQLRKQSNFTEEVALLKDSEQPFVGNI